MAITPTTERARILLALDARGISAELMGHIVTMAARLQAELHGLFVEDERLLRAATLPFAREVAASGRERALEPARVQSASDDAAAAAALLLADHATRQDVRWSFATRAGLRLRAALDAAVDADVLLPARRASHAGRVFGRVSLLADDSAHAERALRVVQALAVNGHVREVLVVSRSVTPALVQRKLAALGVRVYVQQGGAEDAMALLREMGGAGSTGLIILPRRVVEEGGPARAGVVDGLRSALLLLR